jgi:hypothetical protein
VDADIGRCTPPQMTRAQHERMSKCPVWKFVRSVASGWAWLGWGGEPRNRTPPAPAGSLSGRALIRRVQTPRGCHRMCQTGHYSIPHHTSSASLGVPSRELGQPTRVPPDVPSSACGRLASPALVRQASLRAASIARTRFVEQRSSVRSLRGDVCRDGRTASDERPGPTTRRDDSLAL